MRDPFLDKDFLKELDSQEFRVIYAKIISLDFDERPMEEIQGRVTGGSLNVNGDSSLRYTCSINLIAQELNIHDFYWGLTTKFRLFIGLKNEINPDYPDIIWFNKGIYIITSFSTNQQLSSYTVSIQGQDKMCLLNGTVGGAITSLTADFGKIEEIDGEGNIEVKDIPLKEVITEVVHEYAREPYQNIIVKDLDEVGLELLEYRGTVPIYFIKNIQTDEVTNIFMDGTKQYTMVKKNLAGNYVDQGTISLNDENFIYDSRIDYLANDVTPTYVKDENNNIYTVFKVTYGEVVGFRETDLTYPGDLIGNVGNSITQGCFDPIVKMLGDFEYFYDIDGRFHFQRKQTFVNVSWNNITSNEKSELYVEPAALSSAVSYSFENANLISSFQNQPNLANLKNDFSIWGKRVGAGGAEYPVHLRYAIDKKPVYYKNYEGKIYTTGYKTKTQLEEDYQAVQQDMIDRILGQHTKTALPEGLNYPGTLWWNMRDWGELYYMIAGEYPNGGVGEYSQGFTKVDLERYFPGGISWDSSRDLHIFDVTNAADGSLNGPLKSTVHNPYCSHSYWTYFVETGDRDNFTSYIWNPIFPEAQQKELEEQAFEYYEEYHNYNCDWREIIYQMAKDHLKYGHEKDFLWNIANNNPDWYPTGYTGYEVYYTDMVSFWRELYNPDYDYTYVPAYVTASMYADSFKNGENKYFWYTRCNENIAFDTNQTYYYYNNNQQYEKIKITESTYNSNQTHYYIIEQQHLGTDYVGNRKYYTRHDGDYDKEPFTILADGTVGDTPNPNFGWNTSIIEYPQGLNFWFDFLDAGDGSLSNYNVRNVGNRPKAVNDNDIKAIYYRDTPLVVFIDSEVFQDEVIKQRELKPGYTFVQFPNYMDPLFTLSTQKKSAKEALDDFLYQYTYCTESITIQALPVYYLEPNTRIFVRDDNSGLNGEYIVNKISYQLQYNGHMTINAVKAIDRIY